MKYLILLLLISFPMLAEAQTEEPSSAAIRAEDSAKYYFGYRESSPGKEKTEKTNKDFVVQREPVVFHRAYRVNTAADWQDVLNRAEAFARTLGADYKVDKSKSTKKVTVPVTWHYRGGFNECIEDLELKGKIVLEVKDVRTRITLSNISYEHHDKYNGKEIAVAKRNFLSRQDACAPDMGKVELLYNCDECPSSIRSLDRSLQNRFDEWADLYQERLK